MKNFTQFIQKLYGENLPLLTESDIPFINAMHEKGYNDFCQIELPHNKLETWRHRAIDQLVEECYDIQKEPNPYRPVEDYFCCENTDMQIRQFTFCNGWYANQNLPITTFTNGMIIGTLFEALKKFPNLVLPYLSQKNIEETDGLLALNQAFFNDGIFIYIPENLHVQNPIQFVSLLEGNKNLMINNRNLIVVEKNAKASIIHCDDSLGESKSLLNNITKIFLQENSTLHYHKKENKDAESLLVNHIFVQQTKASSFISNVITFNGGYVRNKIQVDLLEPFASAKLYGLYLLDSNQYADNQVKVIHSAHDCTSEQLYQGIINDEAQANFNGHVIVKPQSQRTVARQSNRNITLTDNAKITTQPFLEIYADDVKCSHGSTVGQLDENALFYMHTRGLCEQSAKVLLLYAFAHEAVNNIEISSLKEMLIAMIQKRLRGELSYCDQCNVPCSNRNAPVLPFEIDADLL